MDKDLEKLKEIFLSSDVDSEDYEDNLRLVTEWETSLRESEDFASWQESDVTKIIIRQAKDTYKDNAMQLMINRNMTEEERKAIWSKQDAVLWLLSLIEKDVKGVITQIQSEIRRALKTE